MPLSPPIIRRDPDFKRRPQWLYFDQRFAHSYVLGGHRAAKDAGVVIDYLVKRGDVPREKIGWLGSSSTGIPGLFVTTEGPRLAAIVAFVSTGACREWFDTWRPNGLWRGNTDGLWPETEKLLTEYDPILFATNAFPTAVLMINGGIDKIVDAKTARSFVDAKRVPPIEPIPSGCASSFMRALVTIFPRTLSRRTPSNGFIYT